MDYENTIGFIDDYDEGHDNKIKMKKILLIMICHQRINSRSEACCRQRMVWGDHVNELCAENAFEQVYRMSKNSFDALLHYIRPSITLDADLSFRRTGVNVISPEIILHCVVRWLAGRNYPDIRCLSEISISSFYRVLYMGILAIIKCDRLKFHFPTSQSDIIRMSSKFQNRSTHGIIKGCIGCIDGYLCRIKTPSVNEGGVAKSYFSGHYRAMGVNVQAVCDDEHKFTYFSLSSPGGVNDVRAYRKLSRTIKNLPTGYYVIGANAYVPSEHMLTPFAGSQKRLPANDAYNFYLSQLKIKIEMTFGLVTTK